MLDAFSLDVVLSVGAATANRGTEQNRTVREGLLEEVTSSLRSAQQE